MKGRRLHGRILQVIFQTFRSFSGKLFYYYMFFDAGEMPVSQTGGVITLLPKEESDLLLLSNWRGPITFFKVAQNSFLIFLTLIL